jgi:hypothetical protein
VLFLHVWFGMAVETKIDPIWFGVVEVVTVAFGPDNIESTGWTSAKALTDCDIQFWLWIQLLTEVVTAHQWLVLEKDIADSSEGFVINGPCIPCEVCHCSDNYLFSVVETNRCLG